MRKKRTSRPLARGLRTGAAVLVGSLALWLAWLVGDPAAALDNLRELAGSARVSLALNIFLSVFSLKKCGNTSQCLYKNRKFFFVQNI